MPPPSNGKMAQLSAKWGEYPIARAKYLKQFPVSREAVEALERNLLELALAAKMAASKPPENVIHDDDGMPWHKSVDLMDNIFLCHRPITGGTEYAVVEHFPAHGTNEIWNRG